LPFPNIDPIVLQLGPFAVRWYALGYLAGVFGGAWYATTVLKRPALGANETPPFPVAAIWDFAFWAVIGIVVGTYSSIFLASPLLVLWQKKEREIL
jgi:phosphatidylglycerol:prolipoprotein diacylglycerol transferase